MTEFKFNKTLIQTWNEINVKMDRVKRCYHFALLENIVAMPCYNFQ